MLKNQEAEQPSQTPSNQAPSGAPRVTPAELNAALAAIEARKQAEASRLAGTIPIDQAVTDLHLDSTTDEIWAEVQAQRVKAEAAPSAKQPAAPVSLSQSGPFSLPLFRHNPKIQAKQRPAWLTILPPILIGWVLIQAHVIPNFWSHTATSPAISTAAPILRPLSQVPNDIEVYADASALAQVSAGKPLAQITVSKNDSGNRWKIVKRSGHVYLRGYIARADNLQSLQNQPLTVYSSNDSGDLENEGTSNITLRVDKIPLSNPSVGNDYSSVTVPNFHPDPLTTLDPGS